MNTLILQKCVDELKKENPKIDYILGMLETVIEMMPNVTVGPTVTIPAMVTRVNNANTKSDDQEEIPEAARVGRIATLS